VRRYSASDEQIIEEVRGTLAPRKRKKFAPALVTAMLDFLRSHNLVPKGVGPKTIIVES